MPALPDEHVIGAALLAAGSALLGGALALLARDRRLLLEILRTFAFAAAAGVVALHLLPEVLPSLGLPALLWIAAGFLLPWLLEVSARWMGPALLARGGVSGLRVAAEVGFAALLFHSLAEGLALLAALQARESRIDLEVAIVAHHAPLTAAVALPFLELLGHRAAAVRVLVIASAGALGVASGGLLPGLSSGADPAFLHRATAVTAGALLHIVSDEIRAQRFASAGERLLDLVAGAAGVGVATLGAALDPRAAAPILGWGRAVAAFSLTVAPPLLFAAAFEALPLRSLVAPRARRVLRAHCGGVLVLWVFVGPAAALVALALGLLVAAAMSIATPTPTSTANATANANATPTTTATPNPTATPNSTATTTPTATSAALSKSPLHTLGLSGPPLLALLVVAAAVDVLAPPSWFASLPRLQLYFVAALLGVLAKANAAGAAMLAAALVRRGFAPELALPFLALGALPLRARERIGTTLRVAVGIVAAAVSAELLLRTTWLRAAPASAEASLVDAAAPLAAQIAARPFGFACVVALVALALAMLWKEGVRGWFSPLRHADPHGH